MDKKYVTLFKELAQATAATAETVMDYDRQKGDEKALATATMMRDDFQALADAITGDDYAPGKNEAARLLVGAMILANQLQDKINALKTAMAGYQTDVIPKLKEIVDNAQNDDDARQMANEKFVIIEKE
jgi:hypothetical protein